MAISNSYNQNRYYPFVTNWYASKLPNDEILEAHFFIVNPSDDTPSVWLSKAEYRNGSRIYTFSNSVGGTLDFNVPDSSEVQTVWSSNDSWNGFCVFNSRS